MDVKTYLLNLKASVPGHKIFYKPNPGNAGDALIASATYQLFEEIGLAVNQVHDLFGFDPKGKILIYGGGGNFVKQYFGEARYVAEMFHQRVDRLIFLPSTFSGHEDVLSSLGGNVDIFCREPVSYQYVSEVASGANVMLDHDLAFLTKVDQLIDAHAPGFVEAVIKKSYYKLIGDLRHRELPSPGRILSGLPVIQIAKCATLKKSKSVLHCLRTDRECTGELLPGGNLDLSIIFDYGAHNRALADYSSSRLLTYLSRHDVIRTNRLHIGIAAAILGKSVEFLPNNYFKCRAVYEYSMESYFPNVRWMG